MLSKERFSTAEHSVVCRNALKCLNSCVNDGFGLCDRMKRAYRYNSFSFETLLIPQLPFLMPPIYSAHL